MTSIEPFSFTPVVFEKKNMTKRGTSYAVYIPQEYYKGVIGTLKDTELIAVVLGGRILIYIPAKVAGDKEEILMDVILSALEGLAGITEDQALKEAARKAYYTLIMSEDKIGFVKIEDGLEDFMKGKEVKK